MGTQHCYATLDLCAIRVAQLLSTGAPDTGSEKGYQCDSMIRLGVGVELKAGRDLEHLNGCGKLIAAFKDPDRIKRLTLALDLALLDAELLDLLCGFDLFTSGGQTIGAQFPAVTGTDQQPVCLEAWSKAMDADVQATPDFTSNAATYFHWVFPRATMQVANFELKNEFSVIPVTGFGEENDNITVNGPYDDWPAAIVAGGGITRVGGWFFDATLPANTCGKVEVTSAAS